MTVEFRPVHCVCAKAPVIGEIAIGLVRLKCPDCGRRHMVACDGRALSITLTDTAPSRLEKVAPASL